MQALSLFDLPAEPADAQAPGPPTAAPQRRAPVSAAAVGPLLLAVDGNALAHRAFHAYGPADAAYGFCALLAAVCDVVPADGLVVGVDDPHASVRRERWPGYKASRPTKPPALRGLLDDLPGLLSDLGVAVVCPPGWEADDVLGSAAATAEAAGWRCVVATSDRDALGLVSAQTTLLRLRSGVGNAERVTPARLRREVGVTPDQYVEFAALRGDSSDDLPGINGIGPVGAAALLRAYPSVAVAVADPLGVTSVLGRRAGRALLADVACDDSVFARNVALMSIRRDLPLDLDTCRPQARPDHVTAVLAARGLGAVAGRMAVAVGHRPDAAPHIADSL